MPPPTTFQPVRWTNGQYHITYEGGILSPFRKWPMVALRSACTEQVATPVPAEAGSVPSHEGLGSNNCDGLEDCRKPPIQMDEEQTITIREPDMSAHLPPQYDVNCRKITARQPTRVPPRCLALSCLQVLPCPQINR